MLKVDNLTFKHPGQSHQYCFRLDVAPGEIIAVRGESGAGKSTFLGLIAGFLTPSDGEILLDGSSLSQLPPQLRPVSMLHQADNLFDHLSVNTNLALGLPAHMPKKERQTRIDSALGDVGLAGYGNRRAANLSGGQKQRVALARTLLLNRPILLLDEPFTGLDPQTADTMRDLVKSLVGAQNWHAIIVSHDPDDMRLLGSRHCEIRDGQILELAPN